MSLLMLSWKGLVAGHTINYGGDFAFPEPIEIEGGDVRPPNPGGLKFRAVRDDQQNAVGFDPVNAAAQRL